MRCPGAVNYTVPKRIINLLKTNWESISRFRRGLDKGKGKSFFYTILLDLSYRISMRYLPDSGAFIYNIFVK